MNSEGRIYVTTTGTEIVPYRKNQNVYLERLTSTYDSVRHRRNPVTGFFLDTPKTEPCFVTHLQNSVFLQAQFPTYQLYRIPPTNPQALSQVIQMNPDITPREVQYEMIQSVLSHQQENQWFIHLSQGLGKTLLTVYLISHFNTKSLILCFDRKILDQWYQTMKDKTDIDPKKILMIPSSSLLKKIVSGDFPVWEYDIFMCTPALLVSFGGKNGFHMLSVLMDKMGIGFKVFDEAHRHIASTIKINAMTSVEKTLYLSGDFGQSDQRKEKLYFNMFHDVPIFKPSQELMNTLKFTVGIVIQYNSEPTELQKMSVYTKRGFSFYNYMKYEFQTEIFFQALEFTMDTIRKTNTNHYKILILLNLVSQVDYLYDWLKERYRDDYKIGRFHNQVPEEEKSYCHDVCDMIVSTYQSFGTGIDVSSIKYVISCSICTKIDDNQASGRARPLPDKSDVFYFMLSDVGFPYTKKKLKERLRYLYETKIKDIHTIKFE